VKAFTGARQTPVEAVAVPLDDIVKLPHVPDMERALDLQRAAVHLHATEADVIEAAPGQLQHGQWRP
jgi:hypothetical protein